MDGVAEGTSEEPQGTVGRRDGLDEKGSRSQAPTGPERSS